MTPHFFELFWHFVLYRTAVVCLRNVSISFSVIKKDRYGFPAIWMQLGNNIHVKMDVRLAGPPGVTRVPNVLACLYLFTLGNDAPVLNQMQILTYSSVFVSNRN